MVDLVRDPRWRPFVLVLIVLAAFGLVWHIMALPDHGSPSHEDETVLLLCVALLLTALAVFRPGPGERVRIDPGLIGAGAVQIARGEVFRRHPPDTSCVQLD